jgi:hypothetical protein
MVTLGSPAAIERFGEPMDYLPGASMSWTNSTIGLRLSVLFLAPAAHAGAPVALRIESIENTRVFLEKATGPALLEAAPLGEVYRTIDGNLVESFHEVTDGALAKYVAILPYPMTMAAELIRCPRSQPVEVGLYRCTSPNCPPYMTHALITAFSKPDESTLWLGWETKSDEWGI